MGHMGNGAYGQCGDRRQRGTGDMGHMANEAHRGYGYRVWATWAIAAQWVWGTRGMGHMGNRSHGQWGTWARGLWAMGPMGNGAHGPMGDLDIFANNFINTGWILTKILLDIDINVFYLNTG